MKKTTKIIISISVVLVIALIAVLGYFFIPYSAKRTYNYALNFVVELKASSESVGESFATGVVIKDDGTIITNSHCLHYTKLTEEKMFEKFEVRFAYEDNYRTVSLVKFDKDLDIAVLKIDNKDNLQLKNIKIGSSSGLKAGTDVFAVGNGSNMGISITSGKISNALVNVEYENIKRQAIQCDLTITSGNSGGALFDNYGKLIGITSFRTKDNSGNIIYGISYAIPINNVMDFVNR